MIFSASCTRVDRVRVKEVDFKNISLYQIRFSCVSETKSSKSYDLNSKEYETTHSEQITSFRRYLPQVFKSFCINSLSLLDFSKKNTFMNKILASSVKNLIIVDFGLSMAYSTILIPALMGLNSNFNPDETISITPDQATWLGNEIYFQFIIKNVIPIK